MVLWVLLIFTMNINQCLLLWLVFFLHMVLIHSSLCFVSKGLQILSQRKVILYCLLGLFSSQEFRCSSKGFSIGNNFFLNRSKENKHNFLLSLAVLNACIQWVIFLQILRKSFILIYSSETQHLAFTKIYCFWLSFFLKKWANVCTCKSRDPVTLIKSLNGPKKIGTQTFHCLSWTVDINISVHLKVLWFSSTNPVKVWMAST